MDTLQKTINRRIEELPRLLLASLLDQKLRAQGIKLSKPKRCELADRILNEKLEEFGFDDGRRWGGKRNIKIEFTDTDSELMERKVENFMRQLPAMIDDLTAQTTESVLRILKRRWPSESRAQRRDLNGFRKCLQERWGNGLDKLRILLTIAREYVSELNKSGGNADNRNSPETFEILVRLQTRSCQVAEEIICLLCSGFAHGAMARWRTLHEIAAVSWLIRQHGNELAQRYEQHQVIESRRAALQYQRYQKRLKQRPITDETMNKIEADYAAVMERYGADFGKPYGWAAKHLGKSNPSIADIQEAAGVDHLGPYYRMASHNVHANPHGVFFKLGLIGETNTLLAGPSNAGLADPGHATALSLTLISSVLLHLYPTLDNVMTVKVRQQLTDEIGDAFLSAHKKLEGDDKY